MSQPDAINPRQFRPDKLTPVLALPMDMFALGLAVRGWMVF